MRAFEAFDLKMNLLGRWVVESASFTISEDLSSLLRIKQQTCKAECYFGYSKFSN